MAPGFPCCCGTCPCTCDNCTVPAPARIKVVISGLTGATAADVNTTDSTTCGETYETVADNLDACADCGNLDGTYILYHGGTDDPQCGDTELSESVCFYEPLSLPSDCSVDYMRLTISTFYHTATSDWESDLFTFDIGFEDYCESSGSTTFTDCDGVGEDEELFHNAHLFFKGWLGDYDGTTCCNVSDFALDDFSQSNPGETVYDANGDCGAISGTWPLGWRRRCTSGGAGTVKITALED